MIRIAVVFLLASAGAQAQIQLTLVNGIQQTPLSSGGATSLGQVLPLAPFTFVVQARNLGSSAVPCSAAVSGTGFSLNSPCGVAQSTVAAGAAVNIGVTFSANAPGSYSTPFQFDTAPPVFFLVTVVPLALTTATPCSGPLAEPGANLAIAFGSISQGQTEVCPLTLTNTGQQPLVVTLGLSGEGFVPSFSSGSQVTLAAGASSTFTVTFAPSDAASYSGTLVVDSQSFTLTGSASNPLLPTPILQLDTKTPQSGQQLTLTVALPAPAASTWRFSRTQASRVRFRMIPVCCSSPPARVRCPSQFHKAAPRLHSTANPTR